MPSWYVVGPPYVLVGIKVSGIKLLVSVAYCLKRRIAVHRRLQRISKSYHTLGKGDLPKVCSDLIYTDVVPILLPGG